MILTEREIKGIIETYVREYLTLNETGGTVSGGAGAWTNKKSVKDSDIKDKEGDSESFKELRRSLRTPGLNQAAIVRGMIKKGLWTMKFSSARSYLSKISRGILNPDAKDASAIRQLINQTAGKMK